MRRFRPRGASASGFQERVDTIDIAGPDRLPAREAERILRALPEWFGIESALMDYARDAQAAPNFLARAGAGTIGFVTLREHNPVSLELHCIALLPAWHRAGIGRRLCAAVEHWWAARGGRLVQVKTLGPSRASLPYARTRAFYDALDYLPVEEFTGLWPGHPCLLLVKPLPPSRSTAQANEQVPAKAPPRSPT